VPAQDNPAPPRRGARRGASLAIGTATVLVALFVAWQIIALAQARNLLDTEPFEAVAWRPGDGKALALAAEREFLDAAPTGQDPGAAAALARRALSANPLEVRALRVLAWSTEAAGDQQAARQMMTLAARRSQRDIPSHLWLFHDRLRARDYDAAFGHGDALMRHPVARREAVVLMASAAGSDPRAARALSRRLVYGPEWRPSLIEEMAVSQDPDATLALLLTVKDAGSAIRPAESAALARRLVRRGRTQEGYLAWVLLMPQQGVAAIDNVFDGGFDGVAAAGPFAWTFGRRGAAEIASAPGGRGQALSVRPGAGSREALAQQAVVLPPGLYRLAFDSYLETPGSDRLRWVVTCAGRDQAPLVDLAPAGTRGEWTPQATTFRIPDDCASQRIELRLDGKARDGAWAWFDNLKLDRLDAATGA